MKIRRWFQAGIIVGMVVLLAAASNGFAADHVNKGTLGLNGCLHEWASDNGFNDDINGYLASLSGKKLKIEDKRLWVDNSNLNLSQGNENLKKLAKEETIDEVVLRGNALEFKFSSGKQCKLLVSEINGKNIASITNMKNKENNSETGKATTEKTEKKDQNVKSSSEEDASEKIGQLVLDDVEVEKGQKSFSVDINVKNNPGILGMVLSIEYDDTAFELTETSIGDKFKKNLNLTLPGDYKKGCRFLFDGIDLRPEDIVDGCVMKLNFNLLSNARKGDYNIKVNYKSGEVVDYKLNPVNLKIKNSKIKIK